MTKKTMRILLCCFVILCLAASSVAFASEAVKEGSIRFLLSAKDEPIKNGSLKMYQIGAYTENGAFFWNDEFADCGIDYYDIGSRESAQSLAQIAKGIEKNVWTIYPDGTGEVLMEHVELGLYLITQGEEFDGFTQTVPFVVCVPSWETGTAVYDVTANPKLGTVPPPDVPHTTPDLPKTGQLNWPIPVLIVGGLAFILLGVVLFRKKRNET